MYSGGRRQVWNWYQCNANHKEDTLDNIYERRGITLPVSQRVQMNFIFNDHVRILCLSCNVKKVGKLVRFKQKKLVQINFIFTDNVRILYMYYPRTPPHRIRHSIENYLNLHWRTFMLNLSDLSKKDRNKRHSSPFINVVKGVFFVVRVTLVPASYLSAPSAVHSYRVPGRFIRRLKSLFV
jgi:hypothetical protein